jgi:hypothetical protein
MEKLLEVESQINDKKSILILLSYGLFLRESKEEKRDKKRGKFRGLFLII